MPLWLHVTWAVCGIVAVVGGIAWTILVAWPFMRDTRRAAVEGLAISKGTVEILKNLEAEARQSLGAVERAAKKIEEASMSAAKDALRRI